MQHFTYEFKLHTINITLYVTRVCKFETHLLTTIENIFIFMNNKLMLVIYLSLTSAKHCCKTFYARYLFIK